jgi:hypothetical protein
MKQFIIFAICVLFLTGCNGVKQKETISECISQTPQSEYSPSPTINVAGTVYWDDRYSDLFAYKPFIVFENELKEATSEELDVWDEKLEHDDFKSTNDEIIFGNEGYNFMGKEYYLVSNDNFERHFAQVCNWIIDLSKFEQIAYEGIYHMIGDDELNLLIFQDKDRPISVFVRKGIDIFNPLSYQYDDFENISERGLKRTHEQIWEHHIMADEGFVLDMADGDSYREDYELLLRLKEFPALTYKLQYEKLVGYSFPYIPETEEYGDYIRVYNYITREEFFFKMEY